LPDDLNGFSDRDHYDFLSVFVPVYGLETERPVLDRPLKVGGDIQPRLVTVLTPATTFTVASNFNQNARRVNSTPHKRKQT
jgi:hypothetical protein